MGNKYKNYCIQLLKNFNTIQKKIESNPGVHIGKCIKK